MSALNSCLGKHFAIVKADKDAIRAAADIYIKRGMDEDKAQIKAVEDHIKTLEKQYKRIEKETVAAWIKENPEDVQTEEETQDKENPAEAMQLQPVVKTQDNAPASVREGEASVSTTLGTPESKLSEPINEKQTDRKPATSTETPAGQPAATTVADIHKEADRLGIPWDNSKPFMDWTEKVTGKRELDKLTPEERQSVIDKLPEFSKPAASKARKSEKIKDFGEKIAGARKDYAAKMQDAMEADVAAVPLSKSWPEPDYAKLLESGADPWAVAFMRAARDEVPTKPQSAWKLSRWVEQVNLLRDFAFRVMDGETLAVTKYKLAENKSLSPVQDRVDLYMEVGHSKSLKGVRISLGSYSVYQGVEYNPAKTIWSVEQPAARTAFSNWPRQIAIGDTRAQAIANFKKKWGESSAEQDTEKAVDFSLYSRSGGGVFIGKKIGKNVVELKGGFATVKEARAWKSENQAELVRLLEKYKEVPYERRATNSPRVGVDHRNGADVTPEQFQDNFGFYGVQFGNYVENERRQADLNEAYDALMDLAGVLDIPPKALSLNGELGLAFGARGRGGKDAPSAHYESERVVINLTKARGAGSLAHEWFHAVDNYFSRMGGAKQGFMTAGGTKTGVRQEMIAAFRRVMTAIEATSLKMRSRKLDATRTKDYWSTGLEMAARAFEAYIVGKLQDQNAANDFLANIVSEDYWNAAASLGIEKEGTYPYPTADEVPQIRAAFDHFFKTVETKETERGVTMLSRTIKADLGNIVENPTRDQAENLLARSKHHAMRGLRDPNTGRLYIWDANEAIHNQVARELGITDPVYERLEFEDVGTLPGGVFSGEPGYGRAIAGRPGDYQVAQLARGKGGVGISLRDLTSLVDRVRKSMSNLPTVHVLSSPMALDLNNPAQASLREFIENAGAMNNVEGATHEGEIYLFASGLADEFRAEHVLATHEATHYGLRGVFGSDLDAALNAIWANNADIHKKANALRGKLGLKGNAAAVEEVLADMNPSELVKLKGWRKLAQTMRDWFQSHGFEAIAAKLDGWLKSGLSEQMQADLYVAEVVNAARSWVKGGKRAGKVASGTALQRVWHGTPHIWEPEPGFPHGRPRLDKIFNKETVGENNWSFGAGWYSAEAQGVAGSYIVPPGGQGFSVDGKTYGEWQNVWYDQDKPTRRALTALADSQGNATEALGNLRAQMSPDSVAAAEVLAGWIDQGEITKPEPGSLYQLDIPDATLPFLLDWDRTLSEQTPEVRDALKQASDLLSPFGENYEAMRAFFNGIGNKTGRALYNELADKGAVGMGDKAASEYLASIGIVGNRYLDGQSRAEGTGTYNFVIWDQPTLDKIALLERNGEKLDAMREADVMMSRKPASLQVFLNNSKVRHVVYHATRADFDVFDTERSDLGAHFGTLEQANRIAVGMRLDNAEGTNIMPVWLSLKNPIRLKDVGSFHADGIADQLERKGLLPKGEGSRIIKEIDANWRLRKKYDPMMRKIIEDAGYDGVVYSNTQEGKGDSYIVFNPEQIKSATGNLGTFDGTNPDIRLSRRIIGDSGRQYTHDQEQMHAHIGRDTDSASILANLHKWANLNWQQGIFDQFQPIRAISAQGYQLARLAKGATGAFEAFMHHGKLSLNQGAYDADTSGGVLENLFYPLGKETTDFLYWIAGNRADRLATEGKERLFSPQDIAVAQSLANGVTDFDYILPSGQVTRDRTLIYRDSLRKFSEFNKNALDMAEQSGLIDGVGRSLWEHEFYVPFYRMSEDDGGLRGMDIKKGLVRQKAFEKLKGGKDGLNDLLANTLMNWAHLIDAAAKNRAAKSTLEAAATMGSARPALPGEKKTVWFMDHGKKVEYVVDDPYLLDALIGLDYAGLRGPLWDALAKPKHWLTVGVTASPYFKVRNLIRDSVQSIAVSGLSYNPAKNIAEGFRLTNKANQEYVSALAGGALIRFGTMLEGNEAERARQLIKKGAKDAHILDSESKLRAFYDKTLEPAVAAYNELGNRGEEINRMSMYHQLRSQGVGHAEASLMARDLMDFSMQGSWTTIRILAQTVPFFNARLQGMYKLGMASRTNRAKMATVTGAVALASLALLAAYHDDDDWKKREDWDRDNYWWFKFGGNAFRIPKPFEIGAVATLAERMAELMFDDEMTGKRFREVTTTLIANQLAMNPTPQLIKPIVDLYANKDSFTKRPIESMGMERLDPEYRFSSGTSMAARGASTALGGALSPVEIDHLVRGYFSWLGAFVVGGADMAVRSVSDEPTRPALDMFKFASGGLVAKVDSASSRYVSQVYDQAKELEQAYGTYRDLLKRGRTDEAMAFKSDNAERLSLYPRAERIKRSITEQNKRIRQIENSGLDPETKRERIQTIRKLQEQMAKRLAERMDSEFDRAMAAKP